MKPTKTNRFEIALRGSYTAVLCVWGFRGHAQAAAFAAEKLGVSVDDLCVSRVAGRKWGV